MDVPALVKLREAVMLANPPAPGWKLDAIVCASIWTRNLVDDEGNTPADCTVLTYAPDDGDLQRTFHIAGATIAVFLEQFGGPVVE